MTLTTKETLEWCRVWKDRLGWSNAFLSEKTGTPKGTIDRILSHAFIEGDTAGVKLETIRPIICALTGCTVEELEACDGLHDAGTVALIEKNKYLEADVERLKREAVNQRTFLANQIKIKDRYIAVLGILLSITVLIIITALVIDKLNSDIGFFWIDRMSSAFNGDDLNIIQQGATATQLTTQRGIL